MANYTRVPEWTEEHKLLVRRLARADKTVDLIRAEMSKAMGVEVSEELVRSRCARLGIKIRKRKSAHQGTSTLSIGERVSAKA